MGHSGMNMEFAVDETWAWIPALNDLLAIWTF